MRTTTSSRPASRQLVLAGLLSLLISAPLVAAPASAAAPAEPGSGPSSSAPAERGPDSAPGQAKRADPAPAPAQDSAPRQSTAPKAERTTPGSSNGTSGTRTEPQPLSTADQNGTGANPGAECTHEYCSTRDGSAANNGSGAGGVSGAPCAGCVGMADNKDPKGQAPDGSDANNGYECDGNSGIGRTNPAHTGCRTTTVTEQPAAPTCPAGTPVGGTMSNGCGATEACPAGSPVDASRADGCTVLLPPSTTTVGTPLPLAVLSGVVRPGVSPLVVPLAAAAPQPVAGPAAPSTAAPERVRPGVLPFTGAQLLWLLPAALVALALGLALVGLGRTRGALTA